MAHGWGPHPLQDLKSFENTNGDGTLLYPGELAGAKSGRYLRFGWCCCATPSKITN